MNDALLRSYKNEKSLIATEINRKQGQVKALEHKYRLMTSRIESLEGVEKKDE